MTRHELRGKYYPGIGDPGCRDFERCPVTSRCAAFSSSRQKCRNCEMLVAPINQSPSHEDQDLVLVARVLSTTPELRVKARQVEEATGAGLLHEDLRRITPKVG